MTWFWMPKTIYDFGNDDRSIIQFSSIEENTLLFGPLRKRRWKFWVMSVRNSLFRQFLRQRCQKSFINKSFFNCFFYAISWQIIENTICPYNDYISGLNLHGYTNRMLCKITRKFLRSKLEWKIKSMLLLTVLINDESLWTSIAAFLGWILSNHHESAV